LRHAPLCFLALWREVRVLCIFINGTNQLKDFFTQKGDEKIALGEKYGFRINGPGKKVGCDFLVGGSSMVFNLNAAEHMMSESHKLCTCEHPGYPDDIHFGECLYRLNISIVHHKEFHQVAIVL